MDIHPLAATFAAAKEAKAQADAAFEAASTAKTQADAAFEQAQSALATAIPEGEVRAVVADVPPSLQNVGGRIVEVPHTFLGS